MELKSLIIIDNEMRSLCFNRTFMELKFNIFRNVLWSGTGFNRTFMELKYPSDAQKESGNYVLIVPLWN